MPIDTVLGMVDGRAVSNHDQAVVDMQYSLVAYGKVVMKRVTDVVAMGTRLILIEEVGLQFECSSGLLC